MFFNTVNTDIATVLAELATCLCAELENPTCFCGVLPAGEPIDAMGECDDERCGQAWVRLTTAYPASSVGEPDLSLNNCGKSMSFEAEIGVLRCYPVTEETPGEVDMLAVAQRQVEDMRAMERAVVCCNSLDEYILGSYTPVGPNTVIGGVFDLRIGGY